MPEERTIKSNSRKNYSGAERPSLEALNTGALLRIAESTEKMAINHRQLLSDLDFYKKDRDRWAEKYRKLKLSNSGLKGYITRLKNKLLK